MAQQRTSSTLLNAKETRVSDDLIYQTTAKEVRMRKEIEVKFIRKWKRPEKDILKFEMSSLQCKRDWEVCESIRDCSMEDWSSRSSGSWTAASLRKAKEPIIWISRSKCQSDKGQRDPSKLTVSEVLRIKRQTNDNLENLNYVEIAKGKRELSSMIRILNFLELEKNGGCQRAKRQSESRWLPRG